jgi:hypothetical protein
LDLGEAPRLDRPRAGDLESRRGARTAWGLCRGLRHETGL